MKAAVLDEKGVSQDGRVAVLSPVSTTPWLRTLPQRLINRDEQGSALQSGQGVISIAGIKIFKSMNLLFLGKYGTASTIDNAGSYVGVDVEATTTGENNAYGGASDFDTSCGLIFQKEAAGVVETIGPQVQVTSGDVSVIYQGDVILGRLSMGTDYLNPAACVELHATSTAGSAF